MRSAPTVNATASTPMSSSRIKVVADGPEPPAGGSVDVAGSVLALGALVTPATDEVGLALADALGLALLAASEVKATCHVPPNATIPSPLVWPAAVS